MKCTEIVVFETRVKLCNHIYDVGTSANGFPIFYPHAFCWLVLCKIHNQYPLILYDSLYVLLIQYFKVVYPSYKDCNKAQLLIHYKGIEQ